ncbi:hypothetical protein C5D35_09060 [Rathayibacter toxicus]|nr:hypothetical protein C5D35_09060 [Rathayibacter toxicus]
MSACGRAFGAAGVPGGTDPEVSPFYIVPMALAMIRAVRRECRACGLCGTHPAARRSSWRETPDLP